MARKRASQRPSHSSDSSSDSEGSADEVQIGPGLYQQLGTAAALRRPADFAVACWELAQLTRHLFKRCSKALQGQLAEDMLLAVECCDGRLQSRAALAGLVEAAERALPQAKRAALQRKYRESGVALSRRQRRGGGAAGSDSDEEPTDFSQLPLDAVEQVFRHLDPITLARSACVCP
ncbi:F-box protein [Chlorella sorokiniana]|uniref:F-box protein n=1 Tax=Chlorella sorokiniana TaxID=3076 RepID=A0A2P6TGS5_CHLSO|nr:F-box protein [Chlorella sorokiniana]|eukprot:PRW33327.1 F-box protein [Chlorella sorokiniana]